MSSDAFNHLGRLAPEQRLRDLEALIQVIHQINRSLDPENVYLNSLNGIRSALDADFGCFVLLDPHSLTLKLGRSCNLDASLSAALDNFFLHFNFQTDIAYPDDRDYMVSVIGEKISAVLRDQGTKNSFVIPLLTRKELLGVLVFGTSGAAKILAPKSIDLLMSIGDQVANALENARLLAALKESETWSRTFIEASPDAFWETDNEGNILYANDSACKLIGVDRATILRLHRENFFIITDDARISNRQIINEKGAWASPHARLRTMNGQIKDVSITVRAVRNADGVPIHYQSVFRDVTEQTKIYETLQQRNEELRVLNSIASILANPMELDRALDQVCQQIITITGMESMGIYLLDDSGQHLKLLAQRGMSQALIDQASILGLDDPPIQKAAVRGEAFAVNELDDFGSPTSFVGPRQEGYHAGMAIPLERRGAPIGAIFIGSKTKTEFARSDLELIRNIGRQIGIAVENADLYTRMEKRVMELDGLAKLSMACTTTLDPTTLSRIAIDWTHKLAPSAPFAIIRLLEGSKLRLTACYSPNDTHLIEDMPVDEVFSIIIDKSTQFVVSDMKTSAIPEIHRHNFVNVGIQAIAIVPMVARDHPIGAMALAYCQPHEWQSHETDLLQTIANQIANAIDNARLFQTVLNEQRKVQAIFDSGLSGMYVTDAAGRIVMFNRAAERLTGWTLKDVLNRTWDEVLRDPNLDASTRSLIDEALLQKRTVFAQVGRKIRARDGRIFTAAKAVAPLLDENGNVIGAVGAFWDLSREEQAELERSEFLRLVAHQLRSPLAALLSALQLLMEKPNLSEERRAEMWNVVQSDGERLRRFASQFLSLEATIKSERPIDLKSVPIGTTVHALIKKYRVDKQHQFTVSVSKPEPLVQADPERLENVLRNLVDNAMIYSPKGTRITVSVKPTDQDQVLIQVEDQGPGIPFDEQAKVFRPFYRSPRELGRHTYGHGLGLAIAQRMVREMGGEISVVSEEGHGATFYFTLRRAS